MRLNNKGFTLVELLAAVVIITLLMVIAVPSALHSLNTGKDKSYEILVSNIVIASKELYEEVYSNKLLDVSTNLLYHYDENGNKTVNPIKIDVIDVSSSTITVNLQTLVSNGFLSGTGNDSSSGKKITNPKENNKDIGSCKIKIKRNNTNNKVTYTVESNTTATEDLPCPTTDDYKKGVS